MIKRRKKNSFVNFLKIDIFLILIFLILDLFTKFIFTNKSYFEGSFVYIFFSKNTGSAFSMFSQVSFYNYFIIVLSFIVLGILIWNYRYFVSDFYLRLSFILFLSGLLGNLYDRLVFAYVRDFIGVKYFSIFNLADTYLTLAFVFYLLYEFKVSRGKGKKV